MEKQRKLYKLVDFYDVACRTCHAYSKLQACNWFRKQGLYWACVDQIEEVVDEPTIPPVEEGKPYWNEAGNMFTIVKDGRVTVYLDGVEYESWKIDE